MKKQGIRITIAKNSGFCSGVKRAYSLACVNSKECDELFILGKLVHNWDVCEDLRKRGVKEVKSLNEIKEGTVIFTAHGAGPGLYKKANERGIKIIDSTCPKVVKAQRLAKTCAEKKFQVLIFGDKKHKEVISIKEWSGGKAKIIENLLDAKKIKTDKRKKYCLISQTTQNAEEFKKIISYFQKNTEHFSCFNTICPSTDNRQKEIRELAFQNDLVIIIGGQDSANSKRLFEISKKINSKSYFIENAEELKLQWILGAKSVLVGAGASTPEWVTKRVVETIKKMT
jgi:(E)-4-hydroxy-3-methyl-but-2-enyl pyrophosphate reductase